MAHCRRLRVLVISMGGQRQEDLTRLLAEDDNFDAPVFSPGVPSRGIRSRRGFFEYAFEAGLIPEAEYEALRGFEGDDLSDCLQEIPVTGPRRGSEEDIQLHYSVELWRKAKAINRGRSVFGCALAHLIAMKTFVDDGNFDVLVEDNVRWSLQQAGDRIRQAAFASAEWERSSGKSCKLRYLGWLGSQVNLEWIFTSHIPKRQFSRDNPITIAPFPTTQDIMSDLKDQSNDEKLAAEHSNSEVSIARDGKKSPGGTPVWGNYAYWISSEAYNQIVEALQMDVGALLWKGKRMRFYQVKPIDKVAPRQVLAKWGADAIHICTQPAFFRAPMLTSQIHTQWDSLFCSSTLYQLQQTGLNWSDLALSEMESEVVQHFEKTGQWISLSNLPM